MIYVISDVHGNLDAFNSIIKKINFSDKDEMYILGDVIDRGTHGIQILKRIMETKNMHMLLGNHEFMMMEALGFPYDDEPTENQYDAKGLWYYNGGAVTHNGWKCLSKEEKETMKNYLKNLPLNIDLNVGGRDFKLVHACAEEVYDAIVKINEESDEKEILPTKSYFCVWDRECIELLSSVDDVITIFGHTPTANIQEVVPMEIYRNGNIIGIDCGAAYGTQFGGRLCCLRLDDMEVIYSD